MEHESDATARRYANALFEIGEEHDLVETFHEQLGVLREAFEQSEAFRHLLLHPGIEVDERRSAIRKLVERWDLDERMRNFVYLLLDNERVRKLPAIAAVYRELLDEKEGNLRAEVTSAVELDDDQRGQIQEVLSEMTGRNVILSTEVDESLIGGAVTRIESTVYDGSIRNQLEELKDNILQEV